MSIKYINESFKRLYESEMEFSETSEENELESLLNNTVDSLINNNETHIKAFEIALQNVLENYFPEQSWWEVTNINIFMDLFENRDPYGTVSRIIYDVYGSPEEEIVEESLTEARNRDNDDINAKIAKAISRKSFAKKYEDELKSYGITVHYLDGQGTKLIGPNGKTLTADRKKIYGPSEPGHNSTHYRGYIYDTSWQKRRVERIQQKVDELRDLIDTVNVTELTRKYPGKSVEDAIESAKTEFEDIKLSLEKEQQSLKKETQEVEKRLHDRHVTRGRGHTSYYLPSGVIESGINDSDIDYLTYLTKEPSPIRTNSAPSEYTPKITKYKNLEYNVQNAEDSLDRDKRWYQVLEPDEIQSKIDTLEAEFERQIRELLYRQESNKKSISTSYDRLDKAKKEKADFLRSLGIGN